MFVGPDGREYKWLLKMWISEVILSRRNGDYFLTYGMTAGRQRRHKDTHGKVSPQKSWDHWGDSPSSLEIHPAGECMIDTILVTFVYIEKMRKDREHAAKHY